MSIQIYIHLCVQEYVFVACVLPLYLLNDQVLVFVIKPPQGASIKPEHVSVVCIYVCVCVCVFAKSPCGDKKTREMISMVLTFEQH